MIGGGPTILFEFAGCDHLSSGLAAVDEVRAATTITANSGAGYRRPLAAFAAEVAAELAATIATIFALRSRRSTSSSATHCAPTASCCSTRWV